MTNEELQKEFIEIAKTIISTGKFNRADGSDVTGLALSIVRDAQNFFPSEEDKLAELENKWNIWELLKTYIPRLSDTGVLRESHKYIIDTMIKNGLTKKDAECLLEKAEFYDVAKYQPRNNYDIIKPPSPKS